MLEKSRDLPLFTDEKLVGRKKFPDRIRFGKLLAQKGSKPSIGAYIVPGAYDFLWYKHPGPWNS